MRLYRYHRMVPVLIETVLDKSNSADIRVTALEALSWFPLSYQRRAIYDACEQIIKSDAPETVKYQSLKTKNIMEGYSKK